MWFNFLYQNWLSTNINVLQFWLNLYLNYNFFRTHLGSFLCRLRRLRSSSLPGSGPDAASLQTVWNCTLGLPRGDVSMGAAAARSETCGSVSPVGGGLFTSGSSEFSSSFWLSTFVSAFSGVDASTSVTVVPSSSGFTSLVAEPSLLL